MNSNRVRILSELVSIDAWRDPFSTAKGAGVFVELTFKEGRIGGNDDEIPFTFKIKAKRALLTISIEEPLSIAKSSIARNHPEAEAEYTKIKTARDTAKSKLKAGAKISPASFTAALSAEANASMDFSKEEQLRLIQTIPQIISTSNPVDSSQHSWEMEPSYKDALYGQPWDPVDPPRLVIKPLIKIPKIDPAVKVELKCALEDIEISDLKPKDESKLALIKNTAMRNINEAAAVQHLKLVLTESQLEPENLDNRFSQLVVASILAFEESS